MTKTELHALFSDILDRRLLKKAVFSKPADKLVKKTVAEPYKKPDGTLMLRIETYLTDNKSIRRNIDYRSPDELTTLAATAYRQTNLFTTAGNLELLCSKSGTLHLSGRLGDGEAADPAGHNEEKKYILDPARDAGFLKELGLSDKSGRIHDKKQAKFRQINRFLEIIRDVADALPSGRPAIIYDLCCGKSYLTFAVYYYFTVLCKRDVHLYGVDLKRDVIDYCTLAAGRLGFDQLRFVSGNINDYEPPETPDMVISLHACDIATDIVLYNATRWRAGIILSTPCCHHEMAAQLAKPAPGAALRGELDFILSSPLLKQKFCDVATDALRVKRLASLGYTVTTLELIDPDETPKNLMIRAVRSGGIDNAALSDYRQTCAALGVSPFLDKLIGENEKK